MHQRKVIRDAVVARLINRTAAGTRVQPTRVEQQKKNELPALSVYTLSEPIDPGSSSTSPRELTRELKVEIAGWVAHSSALPVDDAMDALAVEIETAMDADPFIGGTVGDSILEATEMTIVEEVAGKRVDPVIGIVTLTYSVTYRTSPTADATDDFLTANTTTKVVGGLTNDTVPITDLITVQETP